MLAPCHSSRRSGRGQELPGDGWRHGQPLLERERGIALGDDDAPPLPLVGVLALEVEDVDGDVADVGERLDVPIEAERRRVKTERFRERSRHHRVTREPVRLRDGVLEQTVRDDDVPPGQLLAVAAAAAHVLARVDDELQVELGCLATGGTATARRALDPLETRAEGEVALLDGIEDGRRIGAALRRVCEDGVALELVQAQDVPELLADRRRDVGHHVLGLLERAVDHVAGVAGDVGDHEDAAAGIERRSLAPPRTRRRRHESIVSRTARVA